jgi:5-methylcytosine-specific restriction endonuclease McrA
MRKQVGECACGTPLYHLGSVQCRVCYAATHRVQEVRIRENQRRYRRTSKGRFLTLKLGARKRRLKVSLTFAGYETLTSGGCIYCGRSLPEFGHGIDRRNNEDDYTVFNSVPCCAECNSIKSDKLTFDEMVWLMARRKAEGRI